MKLNLFYKSILSISTLSVCAILSCKKSDHSTNIINADATIINTGSSAADGCGWLIQTDSPDSTFSVPDLPAKYMINNLKVHIAYHKLATRFYCGQLPAAKDPGFTEIELDAVETR
ncbi:hypothetical protein SAMN05216490_3319 [Mucilaginibacter mallensis]|uniref:Uncharacterized protein n=1 Tax=Mucilaginibacter mallensis TaxID=652787 RepID=A0A1H1ZZK1_MUCMA|nr:hypothetical protein [Mucilaginibacter mallensis]SDT39221.1 hypothetical protein SAMN05216490_3319 [Mucilaginibacter mallensis]